MSISGGGTPCLYRALFPPDLTFLLLSFSKFGPTQTPAPVSCPPPLPPPSMLAARGAAVDGGPPQSTQKLPKEEILFPLLQAGSCRMFHLEFFGFHVAECSSLDSHWPPLHSWLAILWPKMCWDFTSLPPHSRSMFVASKTKYAREPRRTNQKSPQLAYS